MSGAERPVDRAERIDAKARDWLVRLRNGGARDKAAFEEWFAADPEHADAYEHLLATWEALGSVDSDGVSRETVFRPETPRWWRAHPALAGVAAALLLILGVGMFSLAGLGRSPASAVTLTSRVGEIRTARLDDGTSVTLDTDSQVDAAFTKRERRVRLVRGRARFVVAPDTTRPFLVEAGGTTVSNEHIVDVALFDNVATVAVLDGDGTVRAKASAPLHLSSGERTEVHGAAEQLTSLPVVASETRWTSGMLTFEEAALGDVVAQANRYSRDRIIIDGDSVAALRFTGTFRAADLPGLAHMLAAAFHLQLNRGADDSFRLSEFPPEK